MSESANLTWLLIFISFAIAAAIERSPTATDRSATQWAIPNFAPTRTTAWMLDSLIDDLLHPPVGPGPVTFDSSYSARLNYRIADLNNPILQPWVKDRLRKANEEVLGGEVAFRGRERCLPAGVPRFVIYSRVAPFHFIQTPQKVTIINSAGPEVRRVYLNVPHSANPRPSWYGESIGHYEGGDTLVIDTIAINDKTFLDHYRTPHTDKLHVIERLKLAENGTAVQILIAVDDPGAFTVPWSATQRWRKVDRDPLRESPCSVEKTTQEFQFPKAMSSIPDF